MFHIPHISSEPSHNNSVHFIMLSPDHNAKSKVLLKMVKSCLLGCDWSMGASDAGIIQSHANR